MKATKYYSEEELKAIVRLGSRKPHAEVSFVVEERRDCFDQHTGGYQVACVVTEEKPLKGAAARALDAGKEKDAP